MSLTDIKKLRDITSLGINDCKKALIESKGNFQKALDILKQRGIAMQAKKSSRATSQGLIESYIHFGGGLGVLVEVNCETDFVARTDVFKKFAKDVAMQVAAASPIYLKKEDIPKETLKNLDKSDEYIRQNCLLEQSFIKDNKMTMEKYLQSVISQSGENIVIRRFVKFTVGEENENEA